MPHEETDMHATQKVEPLDSAGRAHRAIMRYQLDVGDLEIADPIGFAEYLATYASGADTMRGYYATYMRCSGQL
jgi:hypothetical protein